MLSCCLGGCWIGGAGGGAEGRRATHWLLTHLSLALAGHRLSCRQPSQEPPPPACIPSALPRSPFLPAGKPPVLSVNPHVPALLAYAQLAAQQVSGAPVVTDGGELIANLSISDIRWAGGSCMRGRPTRGACLLGGRLGAQGFFSQTLVYRRPPPNLPACHAGPSLRSSLARWRCRWPSS